MQRCTDTFFPVTVYFGFVSFNLIARLGQIPSREIDFATGRSLANR